MKIIVEGHAIDVDPKSLERGDHYEFPCGCRFGIRRDLPMVFDRHAFEIDIRAVRRDCPAVYDLISIGKTKGMFQIEQGAGKRASKDLRPDRFDHLIALGAIIRPGAANAVDEEGVSTTKRFCLKKNGAMGVSYAIPELAPILDSTYGEMIYQEQAMAIAKLLAGFSLGEAYKLQKAMSKKDTGLMAKVEAEFMEKARAHGVLTEEQASYLFGQIKKSAKYSFNKSHSCGYAVGTYETAYLKAHAPLGFFTSRLSHACHKGGKDGPLKEMRQLVGDAKNFGIDVKGPRLADMEPHFQSDGVAIYAGLADAKGISDKTVAKMKAAALEVGEEAFRAACGDWMAFLTTFAGHCGAGVVRVLIEVGALGEDRQRKLHEFDAWTRLTDTERDRVLHLSEPVIETALVYDEVEYEVEEPVYDKAEKKAYNAALKAWKAEMADRERYEVGICEAALGGDEEAQRDAQEAIAAIGEDPPEPDLPAPIGTKTKVKKKQVARLDADGKKLQAPVLDAGGSPVVLDPPRPNDTLIRALQGLLARPGAITTKRVDVVRDILGSLVNPPSRLVDTPHWVARVEEAALGVPLSCGHSDAADRSIVNCTVAEYKLGKTAAKGRLLILGVDVQECVEREVRNGDNRGRKMASLVVGDRTGTLEDVVVFPNAWERSAMLLSRPNAVVALGGAKNWKDGDNTFVVEECWEI